MILVECFAFMGRRVKLVMPASAEIKMLDRVKGTRKSSADHVCGADATRVKLDRIAAGL
jgi:hypothetical protein